MKVLKSSKRADLRYRSFRNDLILNRDYQTHDSIPGLRTQASRFFRSGVLGETEHRPEDHFLHHTPKLGIPVEMVQFILKLLLKQRFLAVHHDFH